MRHAHALIEAGRLRVDPNYGELPLTILKLLPRWANCFRSESRTKHLLLCICRPRNPISISICDLRLQWNLYTQTSRALYVLCRRRGCSCCTCIRKGRIRYARRKIGQHFPVYVRWTRHSLSGYIYATRYVYRVVAYDVRWYFW